MNFLKFFLFIYFFIYVQSEVINNVFEVYDITKPSNENTYKKYPLDSRSTSCRFIFDICKMGIIGESIFGIETLIDGTFNDGVLECILPFPTSKLQEISSITEKSGSTIAMFSKLIYDCVDDAWLIVENESNINTNQQIQFVNQQN